MVSSTRAELPRYQQLVDGVVLPVSVASGPALDFCNTFAGWNGGEQREYLATYDHLVAWARDAGLLDAEAAARLRDDATRDPAAAEKQLRHARTLRRALYDAVGSDDRNAWETVGREARTAAAHALLDRAGPPGRRWSVSAEVGLARPVLEIAREASALLATLELAHVRQCPGTGCGWLFVDPSGRRRWCTMDVCGNRAKVRRHAERARAARVATKDA